ncbi:MAG: radical SAM protein [Planctomycetaceae bacterium]|jgi:wyosine [tRNA(Phe)-imidazoG37] synthetase (radical SAM superfamily)|nr:radical SAM protein [Planctomycetaceae bacterium]
MSSLVQYHPRRFQKFQYIYPVVSRRAGGLSIGVNLSPTAQCNFSCVYCQVLAENQENSVRNSAINSGQNSVQRNNSATSIDCDLLESELRELVGMVNDGSLFRDTWLSRTPPEKQVLRDIAFSGDGEPTLSLQFSEVVRRVAVVRKEFCTEATKIVLITNGSTLHREPIRNTLETLLANNGEIWAKLDAGTPDYFRTISRSTISYEKILANLTEFSKNNPLVIQSCFVLLHDKEPDNEEIRHYAERLKLMNRIQRVQIYTVARQTPECWVLPLSNDQLDGISETVRKLTGLQVDSFYST